MRQLFREQLDLAGPLDKHPHARELEGVDRILRDNPDTVVLVLQDLQHGVRTPKEGREGMSADQVGSRAGKPPDQPCVRPRGGWIRRGRCP